MSSAYEVMDSEALLIGFKLFHYFFNIAFYLQVKKAEEGLVEVERKHLVTKEDEDHGGVTIESSEGHT